MTFEGDKLSVTRVNIEDAVQIDGGKTWFFAVPLSSFRMAEKISPAFHYFRDGQELTTGKGEAYTVQDYIQWGLAPDKNNISDSSRQPLCGVDPGYQGG